MIRRRALLAVARDASATDAPRLLTSLLAELGADGAVDPARTRLVLGRGGPLAGELARLATVRVLGGASEAASRAADRLAPAARPLGDRVALGVGLARRPPRVDHGPPDLVWAQGAAAVRMAAALPRPARRVPLVAQVHEMAIGLRRALPPDAARALLDRAAVVVVPSGAAASHLVDDVGLSVDRVAVHPPWVPGLDPARRLPAARRPASVPRGALIVGGAGPVGWRAGTDLFLDLARALPTRLAGREVHLVWLGDGEGPGDDRRAVAEVALRGLEGRVHLVGSVADRGPWLAGCDLLAVTAREEAFPLAALEAGARGVPVVGFRCGGVAEAVPVEDQPDTVVDLFDVEGLAERAAGLLTAPAARRALGGDLRSRVLTHHLAADSVGALWSDVAARLARS